MKFRKDVEQREIHLKKMEEKDNEKTVTTRKNRKQKINEGVQYFWLYISCQKQREYF